MKRNFQKQKGIGLVEIIVGVSIIIIAFMVFLELVKYNLKIQQQSEMRTEAMNLAVETMEAVRGVRDEDWSNFASFSPGIRYYPIISGNSWALTLTNPGPINGIYDRWVIFEKVYRDANDDISSSGAEDIETKKATVTVEWNDRGQIKQFDLITYLTNWAN